MIAFWGRIAAHRHLGTVFRVGRQQAADQVLQLRRQRVRHHFVLGRELEPGPFLVQDHCQAVEVGQEQGVLLGVQTLFEPFDLYVRERVDKHVAALDVVVHHLVLVQVVETEG